MMSIHRTTLSGVLLALGFCLATNAGCTGTVANLHTNPSLPQDQIATLHIEDQSMIVEGVRGTSDNGSAVGPLDSSSSIRSIEVFPGTYVVTLFYEHLGNSRCWEEGLYDRCTRILDRGWWLPGSSLIPGTTTWVAEPGKTYVVKRLEDYWSMAEKGSWSPSIHGAEIQK